MEPGKVYMLYGPGVEDLYFVPVEVFDEWFVVEENAVKFKKERQMTFSFLSYYMLDEARSSVNHWSACSLHVIRILPLWRFNESLVQ